MHESINVKIKYVVHGMPLRRVSKRMGEQVRVIEREHRVRVISVEGVL